jgi:FSR family fosmidomycin resistance protein-like MFS transporter
MPNPDEPDCRTSSVPRNRLTLIPLALLLLMIAHGLVDAFAALVQPLWPSLERSLSLESGSVQWAFVLWTLSTSVSQLFFGYFGDRHQGRWMLWVGPLVSVVCLSAIGWASSLPALCTLLVLGGLGIAAFHPEAAALAGASSPENRSRAMSLFGVGGYLGQTIGPIYSGMLTTRWGLAALAWSAVWGIAAGTLLLAGMRSLSAARPAPAPTQRPRLSLSEIVRGRRRRLLLILLIGMLRVMPAMGVPLALAYSLSTRGATNEQIGLIQAVFMGGIGGGGFACALLIGRGTERLALWALPLAVVPPLLLCPIAGPWMLTICVGLAGFLLGATMPVLISYGQQLLPEGQRVASSLTMGVTWGLAGAAVAGTMALLNRMQQPNAAFYVFAAGVVVSSVLCAWLPAPKEEAVPTASDGVDGGALAFRQCSTNGQPATDGAHTSAAF